MKKYNVYKPSGVGWIGEVPEGWKMMKLKYITSYNDDVLAENTTPDDVIKYVEIADVNSIEGITNYTEYEFKDAPSRARRITKKNDVIVSTVRTYLKAIAKVHVDDLIVSTGFIVLRPQKINEKFLAYSTLSETFIFDVISQSVGVSYPAINSVQVVNIKIPVPPQREQTAIAEYLDAKCAKIDNVVVVQQKRIKLLKELKQSIITHAVTKGLDKNAKMKDSGIEWIGEVPKEWRVMKINYLVNTIADVNHYMPNDVDCGYPYVMTGDLKEYANEIDFENCKQISETDYKELSTKVKAEKGDVIFARYATIGTVCYVDIEKDFIVSYSCVTIKPKYNILQGKFLYYYLKSHTFFEGISQSINSNTQGNVGIESLSAEKMVVPSTKEQTAITTYLDKKCAIIDQQIAKVEKQIELLNEYKQSVITECVTGKRKVC